MDTWPNNCNFTEYCHHGRKKYYAFRTPLSLFPAHCDVFPLFLAFLYDRKGRVKVWVEVKF